MYNMDILEKMEKNIDGILQESIEFLSKMIEIPTENPPGTHYDDFALFFYKQLKMMGYDSRIMQVPENRVRQLAKMGTGSRPSIIGTKGNGKIKIAFNGHYDVVPAGEGWKYNPFKAKIENGCIYGRGSSDMKGGIAMQLFAVKLLERVFPDIYSNLTIIQTVVPDEETVGNKNAGTYFLVDQGIFSKENVDYVIYTEPLGSGNLCYGHRGGILLSVNVYGKKSHGSMAFLGKDSISFTSGLILHINEYIKKISEEKISAFNIIPDNAKRPSLVIGSLHCGTWANTVADKCNFTLFRRIIPEENLNDVRNELMELFRSYQNDSGFKIKIDEYYATESVLENTDKKHYSAFGESIREVLKINPGFVISPGTFDMRFTNVVGIPSLNYGPGILEESHMNDEKLKIDDLRASIIITALGLYKLAMR